MIFHWPSSGAAGSRRTTSFGAAAAQDLASCTVQSLFGFLAVAGDRDLLVAVVVEPPAVGGREVALELALELRLLLGR